MPTLSDHRGLGGPRDSSNSQLREHSTMPGGKVIYGRITEAPWCLGLDSAWPKFRTHLQFLCLPNLQASGKEQKAQRGNLSKNIYSLCRGCLQETADPLKEVLNLRIQLRITVPGTGWGANHTTTLSGR